MTTEPDEKLTPEEERQLDRKTTGQIMVAAGILLAALGVLFAKFSGWLLIVSFALWPTGFVLCVWGYFRAAEHKKITEPDPKRRRRSGRKKSRRRK